MATPVEQIKERLSIVEVVSSYVQLSKAGRHYKGKSPFTNEKTPSFFVSPERGMYYCFSSGKGGDIFTFIEEMEGVDFKGALKLLAEWAHVELVPENPQKRTEREALYALAEAAATYFTSERTKHPDIGAYLARRGVREQTIAKWRIGYAPEGWRNLKDHLAARGFGEQLMLRAGLVKKSEDGKSTYDVFRDRIMFPIADASGRVIAFSGRTMSKDAAMPKYVNSPETELYQKSHVLFGYDKAKSSIRTHDFSLIVEGQFDLVLAHQAGFTNTVAISGTALSAEHAALLERLSHRVVLALDADRAGVNSVKRAAQVMLPRGMDIKVAALPEGKDPADLVAEDPARLKEAVRTASTVVEFLVSVLRRNARDERAFRLSVRDEVLPFLLSIPSPIEREHFEEVVSEALATTKDAVHYEVERLAQAAAQRPPQTEVDSRRSAAPSMARTRVHPERHGELPRFLYGIILWQETVEEPTCDVAEMRRLLEEALEAAEWEALQTLSEEEKNKIIFHAERHAESLTPAGLLAEIQSALREVLVSTCKRRLRAAREELRRAETAGDEEAAARALDACTRIQKQLGALENSVHPEGR